MTYTLTAYTPSGAIYVKNPIFLSRNAACRKAKEIQRKDNHGKVTCGSIIIYKW